MQFIQQLWVLIAWFVTMLQLPMINLH
jgi:hypothetical protein